ncbi:MAG: type IIL restriction-modification enzyme MmeI [Chloroflexota bacterium]
MTDPEELKPRGAAEELTAAAAGRFAELAQALRARGEDPQRVARFLDRLLFLLFAEDTSVLPRGLLGRLMEATEADPDTFEEQLSALFSHISAKGGFFGAERVPWINGSLFTDGDVLKLTKAEIKLLIQAGMLDWSKLEPSIFGTLFERGLDPGQRSALGAHFTSATDIERVVEPVVLAPLRREANASRLVAKQLLDKGGPANRAKALAAHHAFLARLRAVRVLDPACGSGNFLYIALRKLKDLEYEQALWASSVFSIPISRPEVGPQSVLGIEINPYAAELARLVIWIGDLQWNIAHNFGFDRDPVLKPLDGIRTGDALLDVSDPSRPADASWPEAEFIVGNPPFLGRARIRSQLGDPYAETLFDVYRDRVPAAADLVTYWHERAREAIAAGRSRRAGLLANQSVRSGASRHVLERIAASGQIFYALSDEPWVLAGASVHISIIGQDDGSEQSRVLDGFAVGRINPDLTAGLDLTAIRRLDENLGIGFQGPVKIGPFEIDAQTARAMLASPNPDGRSNADVIRPWMNGLDVMRRPRHMQIIDFADLPEAEAALYEAPYEYVRSHVKPERAKNRRAKRAALWWHHGEYGWALRRAVVGLSRLLVTTRLSPYRVFVWVDPRTLPDSRLVAFARDDDYFLGLLQSRVHEVWSRHTAGAQRREAVSGFTYTPTTCFETFAFPEPSDDLRALISEIARKLCELRDGWMAGSPQRTITALYNARPTWLAMAHEAFDNAVLGSWASRRCHRSRHPGAPMALNLERASAALLPDDNEDLALAQ